MASRRQGHKLDRGAGFDYLSRIDMSWKESRKRWHQWKSWSHAVHFSRVRNPSKLLLKGPKVNTYLFNGDWLKAAGRRSSAATYILSAASSFTLEASQSHLCFCKTRASDKSTCSRFPEDLENYFLNPRKNFSQYSRRVGAKTRTLEFPRWSR